MDWGREGILAKGKKGGVKIPLSPPFQRGMMTGSPL